jgi:integrase
MKMKYRLIRRGGVFYAVDTDTLDRQSLKTKSAAEAQRLLNAKNEAHQQPQISRHLARVYWTASDPEASHRTWQVVMDEMGKHKRGPTQERWQRAIKQKSFDLIRQLKLIDTRPEHFLRALDKGTISTNMFLRRLHNFAVDTGWFVWPVLPKKHWPPVRHQNRRAISAEEHQRIITIEWLPERKAFYQLLWHLGGSQSDIALLCAEDIDWRDRTVCYSRRKTNEPALIHFSEQIAAILKTLPQSGALFPRISKMHERHRAAEFKRRCQRLKIEGVTLHSYRYAWAERAKSAGLPERFAQEALGQNSLAVHRAYARKAKVKVPALEEYERKILPMPEAVTM